MPPDLRAPVGVRIAAFLRIAGEAGCFPEDLRRALKCTNPDGFALVLDHFGLATERLGTPKRVRLADSELWSVRPEVTP